MSTRMLAARLGALCPGDSLQAANEFVEACLAETSPGAYVDPTRLAHRPRRGHPVLRAVPGQWWTWIVQLLLPNQGPAMTSFATVEEALVTLTAAMLLHALGTAETAGVQEVAPIPSPAAAALLAWTVPVPLTGAPAAERPSRATEEVGDEWNTQQCRAAVGRGGGTGARRL